VLVGNSTCYSAFAHASRRNPVLLGWAKPTNQMFAVRRGGHLMVRSLADDDLDDSDRKLLSDIDRVGWHVVMIPEEDGTPGWSFSVGLFKSFNHPEVVVFGLPLELSGQVINGISAVIQKGKTFESGQESIQRFSKACCVLSDLLSGGGIGRSSGMPAGTIEARSSQYFSASGPTSSSTIPGSRNSSKPGCGRNRFCSSWSRGPRE